MLSSADLHRRGLDETNAGRPGRARKLLRTALGREPDHELKARILLSLAHAEFDLGEAASALELCEEALSIEGVSAPTRGLIRSQRGLLHMRTGDGNAALVEFADAIKQLGHDPEPLATVYLNRGAVYQQRGDVGRARADLEMAVEQSAGGDPVLYAKSQHNLGYTLLQAGDLVAALALMDEARECLGRLSTVSKAVGEQDRAEVLLAAGMTSEAAESLREAATAYGKRGLRTRQAEAESLLARLMVWQEPIEAARIARRAKARFAGRGSHVWALRAEAIEVAGTVEARKFNVDVDSADTLTAELRAHGLDNDADAVDLEVSRAELRIGALGTASTRLVRAKVRKNTPLSTRLLRREVSAELAAVEGRRGHAMQHIRRGLAELHAWQSSFGSLDLQSSLVGHGRRLALQGLSLAVSDGRPDVVFEWSERARALASRVAPVRPPGDPDTADELTRLRRVQAELAAAEATGSVSPGLRRRATDLRARIRQRAWYDAGSGVVTEPVSLADVRRELDGSGGVLASYVIADDHLHVLVVRGDRSAVVDLGPYQRVTALLQGLQADLDMAATHLTGPMRDAVRGGLRHRLATLADHLVRPIEHLLGDERLVVVPTGYLAGTPWTMLPGLVQRPLTVPRSASAWVGDRVGSAPQTAGFVAGPRVARAEEEVSKASSAWARSTVVAGDDATASAVSDLACQVDVFHVAAHGRHSADNPLFSGLELAEGPWFGYDIDQLPSIPATVVLSACELGRSTVRWGEEAIGMTVAWLHAGARCVVASPASVDDDLACDVLAQTHQRLAAGDPPADALAAASLPDAAGLPASFLCFGSGW